MSAWSDWRCGAISEEEYKFLYNHELGEDHGEDELDMECEDPEEYPEEGEDEE